MSERDFSENMKAIVSHIKDTGHPLYQASMFWERLADYNVKQLDLLGLYNFKRTVSQAYFNFIPLNEEDDLFRAMAGYWGKNPSLEAMNVKIEGGTAIHSPFGGNLFEQESIKELYRLFLGMLWHHTKATCGNALPSMLSEPSLGNPIPCSLGGKLISQDLANSIRECTVALSPLGIELPGASPFSVVEIGAGYGRLAFVMLSSTGCRYTIVDIPPALALSQWYLTTLFPDKKAFRFRSWRNFDDIKDEFASSEICFITPDQFAAIPEKYFDVGVTISTLPEMTRTQFDFYISRLASTMSKVVYTKQWAKHDNVFDRTVLTRSDFVLPDPWRLEFDRIDSVLPTFFEKLWVLD